MKINEIVDPINFYNYKINYLNVFEFIHSKNYKGILGMEHGNYNRGKEGEMDVIKAYKKVDQFI